MENNQYTENTAHTTINSVSVSITYTSSNKSAFKKKDFSFYLKYYILFL